MWGIFVFPSVSVQWLISLHDLATISDQLGLSGALWFLLLSGSSSLNIMAIIFCVWHLLSLLFFCIYKELQSNMDRPCVVLRVFVDILLFVSIWKKYAFSHHSFFIWRQRGWLFLSKHWGELNYSRHQRNQKLFHKSLKLALRDATKKIIHWIEDFYLWKSLNILLTRTFIHLIII